MRACVEKVDILGWNKSYEKLHPTRAESKIREGGIQIKYGSTIYALVSICHTLNFIEIWIQSFEENTDRRTILYKGKLVSCSRRFL